MRKRARCKRLAKGRQRDRLAALAARRTARCEDLRARFWSCAPCSRATPTRRRFSATTTLAASDSLRDAILDANADPGTATDTIVLGSGTYSLTIPNVGGARKRGVDRRPRYHEHGPSLVIEGEETAGRTPRSSTRPCWTACFRSCRTCRSLFRIWKSPAARRWTMARRELCRFPPPVLRWWNP